MEAWAGQVLAAPDGPARRPQQGGAGGQGAGGSLSQTRGLEPQATGRGIPPQPESVQGRRTGAGSPAGVPLASSGADSLQSLVERGRDSGG